MARRNLFQPPPPPAPAKPEAESAQTRQRFPATGAMTGMKATLRDLSSNAIREIDPSLIEDGGPKDRLGISQADVEALADSIARHGQQVPIMLRTIPEQPGRYQIVYGRRRLAALRLLGQSAKALVRSLNDTQAIIAQGQENSQRLDPSFIEKALFAAELAQTGYGSDVIMDALAIDKPMLSRMHKVARLIPETLVRQIGAAHGIGRRRWEELADLLRDGTPDWDGLIAGLAPQLEKLGSDEKFALIADRLKQTESIAPPAPSKAQVISAADGQRLGEMRSSGKALTLKLTASDCPDFTQWLRDNAETGLRSLYDAYLASSRNK